SSSTEAPSLHRGYPASSVLQASPPPQAARPVSRELPVDPLPRSPLGASRVASGLLCLHAVALTPAGSMEPVRSCFSIVSGLPLCNSPVGSCNYFFGACSAFTRVTACTLTESPT